MSSEILSRKGEFMQSFDLGLTESSASFDGRELKFNGFVVPKRKLEVMSKHMHSVFMINEEGVFRIALHGQGGYYQLVFFEGSPTVEINGIRMHRTSETHPFEDGRMKVEPLKLQEGMRVLDTCTGLGYTSIWAKRAGAKVTSIEVSPEMTELARINPWSRELFEGIELLEGDALEVIKGLKVKFDAVIHDPPTFALAGHLYSLEFYKLLHEKTKPNALMYHYIGKPGEKYRGGGITSGVRERVIKAGWRILEEVNLGILCQRV